MLSTIRSRVNQIAEGHQRYHYKFNISEHGSSSNTVNSTWYDRRGDALKYALPDNNCGSRILLITRIGGVTSTSCVESQGNIYVVKALSPKESWILFCWKTFQENYCPPHLEELSQSILEKCEGLAIIIVEIGGVLATKDKTRMDEWEMVLRSLGAELEGRDKLERFVEAKEGMTSEEVAEGYLNELVSRSLVQVATICYDGRLRSCHFHDLFCDIIISKSIEQSIAGIVGEENTGWPEKVLDLRGASLETVPNEVVKLFHLRYLSLKRTKIRTLPNSIGELENLEMLDLKDTYVTEFPVQILKLRRIRHLLVYRYTYEAYQPFHRILGFKMIVGIEVGELGRLTHLRKLCITKLRRQDKMALCSTIEKPSNLHFLNIGSVEEDKIIDIQSLSSPPRFL
ncbi:disease resistance protein RPM1-like [Cornus florida]|uniref:disease resistance protein RPM1-like n=1 Tax=Cornus florida TaxID=4283 RepID=UPI002899DB38|nr:disease resistance protein RPM1-like [Cornus florida]